MSNTCSLCNRTYVWPADLKRHLKTKHGQQKSKEKICSPTDRGIYTIATTTTTTITTTVHNEYARDCHSIEKTSPSLRSLWEIRIQTIEWDNTGSLYTSMPTQEGNTTTILEHHPFQGLSWILWTNIVRVGHAILFEHKKKDLQCVDIIAFLTSFIDVQGIAWHTSPGS
jgi:hypothetical protein